MDEEEEDRYRAPALDKGLDILELLAGIDGGLTQAEIAKRLGRSPDRADSLLLARYARYAPDRFGAITSADYLTQAKMGQ